jgi:hypothetical protein
MASCEVWLGLGLGAPGASDRSSVEAALKLKTRGYRLS